MGIAVHVDPEFKALIPPLSPEEFSQLEANVIADGCREAIVIWGPDRLIVDGHNRYEICCKHKIGFKTYEIQVRDRDEVKIWIIRNQFGRRNITAYQRCELALVLEPLLSERARHNQGKRTDISPTLVESVDTQKEIARVAGVSHGTLHKAKTIAERADEETKEKLRRNEITINAAFNEIRNADRREERIEKLVEISKGNAELKTPQRYPVLLADPPWRYEHVKTESRAIENQYPTMDLDAIENLPIDEVTTDDCVLFLWTTSPKLAESLQVIESWGFNYRTCFAWVKDKIGMGYWARQRHELLLVCVKGEPPTPPTDARFDSVIEAPRGKHSAKPDVVYEMIEKMYPELPKLELFCRSPRDGWAVWGNQAA